MENEAHELYLIGHSVICDKYGQILLVNKFLRCDLTTTFFYHGMKIVGAFISSLLIEVESKSQNDIQTRAMHTGRI